MIQLKYIAIVGLLVLCAGCKKVKFDCTYTLIPLLQQVENGPQVSCSDAIGYLFYADTARYEVSSYADALAGVVTEIGGGTTKSYDLKTAVDPSGRLIFGGLNQVHLILLVCDPTRKLYAWKGAAIEAGLEVVTTKVRFRLWKTTYPYLESLWNVNQIELPKKPE